MKSNIHYLVTLFLWGIMAATSHAQQIGGGVGRPAVSPYLNLLRGGDPAINYYGLVRPQLATANALQGLGNDFNALQNNVNANQFAETGHRSSFMTQSAYFMTNNAPGRRGGQYGAGMGGGGGQFGGGQTGGGQPGVPAPGGR